MSVEELRAAVAVALAAFLLILRLDAERLGAAEYDEPDDWGRRPPFLPRLGWYFTGIALVDRKSTRLNLQSQSNLVCRLLLGKKRKEECTTDRVVEGPKRACTQPGGRAR